MASQQNFFSSMMIPVLKQSINTFMMQSPNGFVLKASYDNQTSLHIAIIHKDTLEKYELILPENQNTSTFTLLRLYGKETTIEACHNNNAVNVSISGQIDFTVPIVINIAQINKYHQQQIENLKSKINNQNQRIIEILDSTKKIYRLMSSSPEKRIFKSSPEKRIFKSSPEKGIFKSSPEKGIFKSSPEKGIFQLSPQAKEFVL
jgi:hypothetical protein